VRGPPPPECQLPICTSPSPSPRPPRLARVEYLPEAAGAYSVSVRLALTAEAVLVYGRGGTGAPGLPELRAYYSSRGQEAKRQSPMADGSSLPTSPMPPYRVNREWCASMPWSTLPPPLRPHRSHGIDITSKSTSKYSRARKVSFYVHPWLLQCLLRPWCFVLLS